MAPMGSETTNPNIRQNEFQRFNGKYSSLTSAESCDSEAQKIIDEVHRSHNWQNLPEQLLALRMVRERHGETSGERRTGT